MMTKDYIETVRTFLMTKTKKVQRHPPAKTIWLLVLLFAVTALHAQTVLSVSGATTGTWTAPSTGGPYFVRITAKGGDGGLGDGHKGGQGATLSGIFEVQAGQTI